MPLTALHLVCSVKNMEVATLLLLTPSLFLFWPRKLAFQSFELRTSAQLTLFSPSSRRRV